MTQRNIAEVPTSVWVLRMDLVELAQCALCGDGDCIERLSRVVGRRAVERLLSDPRARVFRKMCGRYLLIDDVSILAVSALGGRLICVIDLAKVRPLSWNPLCLLHAALARRVAERIRDLVRWVENEVMR